MCNLYTVRATQAEINSYFQENEDWRRRIDAEPINYAEEVYPGYAGPVIAEGNLRSMAWGFPLRMVSKRTGLPIKPKPVNNARTDKLTTPFWRSSFENRRCLIPVTAFAEAEGEAGCKKCTRISLPDQPIFACAGIWRWSEEWGEVYSMVMTESCDSTACVHDRMPVILKREDYAQWTQGTPPEAFELCLPYDGAVTIDRLNRPWNALSARPSKVDGYGG